MLQAFIIILQQGKIYICLIWMLKAWDVESMRCWKHEMLKAWDVERMRCWKYSLLVTKLFSDVHFIKFCDNLNEKQMLKLFSNKTDSFGFFLKNNSKNPAKRRGIKWGCSVIDRKFYDFSKKILSACWLFSFWYFSFRVIYFLRRPNLLIRNI